MAEPEGWQVSTDAAEVYESCFEPAIFGAWAGLVSDAGGIALPSGEIVMPMNAHIVTANKV